MANNPDYHLSIILGFGLVLAYVVNHTLVFDNQLSQFEFNKVGTAAMLWTTIELGILGIIGIITFICREITNYIKNRPVN